MNCVTTQSGTVYVLNNSRVERLPKLLWSDEDRVGYIRGDCFRHMAPLEVGKPMMLDIHGIGVIRTSPVVNIERS